MATNSSNTGNGNGSSSNTGYFYDCDGYDGCDSCRSTGTEDACDEDDYTGFGSCFHIVTGGHYKDFIYEAYYYCDHRNRHTIKVLKAMENEQCTDSHTIDSCKDCFRTYLDYWGDDELFFHITFDNDSKTLKRKLSISDLKETLFE